MASSSDRDDFRGGHPGGEVFVVLREVVMLASVTDAAIQSMPPAASIRRSVS